MSATNKIVHKPIVVVLGDKGFNRCFEPFGEVMNVWPTSKAFRQVEEQYLRFADVVVFTGGSDVDPNIYGEQKHSTTHSDIKRDIMEQRIFIYCQENNIKMVGICRGSQFLTVMSGGKLVQHITNHAICGTHDIVARVRKSATVVMLEHIEVTSTHHQMMYPWCMRFTEYDILAYARGMSASYRGAPECEADEQYLNKRNNAADVLEPEVVWYNGSKSLCVQFHPEIMGKDTKGYEYFQHLLAEQIFN